jgi:glycosyltransferase involved in cell wall biosynthesis
MRILVDYRPALRARTGVGEWIHNLVRTVIRLPDHRAAARAVSLFVSSWKDRPHPEAREDLAGADFIDRRIPVRVLTWAWHRMGWPTVERLSGRTFDVAFSPTPLLLPSRARLRVVTVHDLDFLAHPERTWGEMRRDYPALVSRHTRRADLVVTISQFTAAEARRILDIPAERIVVVRPGVPDWVTAAQSRSDGRPTVPGGYILFVGTLEARKNVAGLLDAYARLVSRMPDAPRLVLAGGPTPESAGWLARAADGPAAGRVDARGYIQPADRATLYAGAAMLVLPSYMEGFGLPVLEAMALGIPVIVSTRGALPEVAGHAGLHVPPDDTAGLAEAMYRVLHEPGLASAMRERGDEQARQFSWEHSAATLVEAFADRLRRNRGETHAHRH